MSIGVPAYNGGQFIAKSLEALVSQDYPNIELIISDDGSIDDTRDVCAQFARADPRITVLEGSHQGERQNFNTVLLAARGEYFMWAADHDLWHSTYVSGCVAALVDDPFAVIAYARSVLIDEVGRELEEMDDQLWINHDRAIDRYRALIWRLEVCNAIYGVMRTELLKATGGYGPFPAPDHLVLAQMALRGTFVQLPSVLFFRRQNRPQETAEQQLHRQPFDLDPGNAARWVSRAQRDYFRELRDSHLAAVWSTPLPLGERLLGTAATVACFRDRFGVGSRSWGAAAKLTRVLPTQIRVPILRAVNPDSAETATD